MIKKRKAKEHNIIIDKQIENGMITGDQEG